MSKCDNCRLRIETAIAFDIHWHGQEDCPYDVCPEIKTNGDRIRAMSDEELADWVTLMVCKYRSCGNCPMSDWCTPGRGIADWIKSPVEVDNG